MDADTRNKMAELHAIVRELRRELNRIPSRTPPVPIVPTKVSVASSANNKALAFGSLKGLYYDTTLTPISPASPLTTAYDPASPVAITDKGIAYATAIVNGVAVNCLLVNRIIHDASANVVASPLVTADLPNGTVCECLRQIAVPVPGSLFITAYEVKWL